MAADEPAGVAATAAGPDAPTVPRAPINNQPLRLPASFPLGTAFFENGNLYIVRLLGATDFFSLRMDGRSLYRRFGGTPTAYRHIMQREFYAEAARRRFHAGRDAGSTS